MTVPFSADWRRPSPAFNWRRRSPPLPLCRPALAEGRRGYLRPGATYSRHYSSTVDQRRPTPVACLRAAPRRRRSPPLGRRRLAPAYGPASAVACLRPVPRRRRSPPGPTLPPSTGAGRRAGVGHRLSSPVSPAVNRRLPSPAFDRRRSGPTRPPSTGARLADGRRVPSTSAVAAGTS